MRLCVQRSLTALAIVGMLLMMMPGSVLAQPPAPEPKADTKVVLPPDGDLDALGPANVQRTRPTKPVDFPNPVDKKKMMERQQLMEAGRLAEANRLAAVADDRILTILVEFAGTDVFTWTQGVSNWDPLGIADPAEETDDDDQCSNIITQTRTFTYTGPLHNEIPRPLSAADRSGTMIWTPDFSSSWYNNMLFGNGVTFNYTRTDDSLVQEDFTGKSVKDYYRDMSGGSYSIAGDVIGWLQLPHSIWWYGADTCPGARSGSGSTSGAIPNAGSASSFVQDALDAVNAISSTIPGFSWANYDKDGNGIIDRLWIVHAGYGEEDSPTLLNRTSYGEASLWSHSSGLYPVYSVTQDIAAGPYIMMPENGGIGVFAHEYGHNLGADDLYAYIQGETSAGFWTLMADDWTGYPIGYLPPAVDPWHLDNWGWLNPRVITDASREYTVTIGQASNYPGGQGMVRGVKIQLPNGATPLPVAPTGSYYWWGGAADLSNAMMTTKEPIAIPGAGATLVFSTAFAIETGWDFLWVQASNDSGATWNTLTNTNTICTHDPGWIGGLYGFPDNLCAAGLGGFTDYNASFPDFGTETFSLDAFANQNVLLRLWYMTDWGSLYHGPFVDSVRVMSGGTILLSDDAESGDARWNYSAPWVRSDGTRPFTHNYYLQWRNVGANGGYDSSLGDPRWQFGPANTGLVVWYNNNLYTDNEIWTHLFDDPGFGPKGRMLVVDSHPEPYRDPYDVAAGYDNEGGNVSHRSQMRDAPFTLNDTVSFTMASPNVYTTTQFAGRPAVRTFSDALGYFPGAEYVSRGPGYVPPSYKWIAKQWDASVVVPGRSSYGISAPGYTANAEFRWSCEQSAGGRLSCFWVPSGLGYNGGTGNPGDVPAAYGWNVQLIEEAPDHSWVKVRIYHEARTGKVFLPAIARGYAGSW